MFGNSKEYQDIQKLYLEKVSKPEQLDEGLKDFIDKGGVAGAINRSMKKNEPIKKLRKAVSNIEVGSSTDSKKFKPFKSLAPKKPIGSNTDTSSEIESSESEFKANEGGKFNQAMKNKMKNKMSSSSGSTRPTAQDLAKQRIGSGTARNPDTTIAQANQRNRDAMKERARARNAAFQKKREEFRQNRKAGISNSKPQEKVKSPMDMRGESYDAYDVVLEYLLTSQQAATIEEANYIMTEMDAETIQDIVSQQLNEQN